MPQLWPSRVRIKWLETPLQKEFCQNHPFVRFKLRPPPSNVYTAPTALQQCPQLHFQRGNYRYLHHLLLHGNLRLLLSQLLLRPSPAPWTSVENPATTNLTNQLRSLDNSLTTYANMVPDTAGSLRPLKTPLVSPSSTMRPATSTGSRAYTPVFQHSTELQPTRTCPEPIATIG